MLLVDAAPPSRFEDEAKQMRTGAPASAGYVDYFVVQPDG